MIVGVAAVLLEIPGERGQEDNLEALQQTKQGQHILEEHEETNFARQNQVALDMKFTIVILSDWQVTLLLTPGHVRDNVKKVEDDHVVCREQLQRLLHLGGHLFHGCLIQCHPRTAQIIISRPRSRRLSP